MVKIMLLSYISTTVIKADVPKDRKTLNTVKAQGRTAKIYELSGESLACFISFSD